MNILVTINKNYLKYLFVMLTSLIKNNNCEIFVYIVSNDVTNNDVDNFFIKRKAKYQIIKYTDEVLDSSKTTSRYPSVIYYRLLASKYLPTTLDRVLYLDPDIIILKDLSSFYNVDFGNSYYVGASNIKKFLTKFNELKNKAPKDSPYLNTGVLLINLKELRKIDCDRLIYDYIEKNQSILTLPDQDILQGVFGDKVKLVSNLLYNLSDREIIKHNLKSLEKIDNKWVEENTFIIHYIGKNKPWSENYKGILQKYYLMYSGGETNEN